MSNRFVTIWNSAIASRLVLGWANPVRSIRSLYTPGFRFSTRYRPRVSVTTIDWRPVLISVAVTVAPGSTPWDWSTTVPWTVASCCADTLVGKQSESARTGTYRSIRSLRTLNRCSLKRAHATPALLAVSTEIVRALDATRVAWRLTLTTVR